MKRLFNKLTKTEVIRGIHLIDSNVIELEDDNIFFKDLPLNKKIKFSTDGLPKEYEDIPEIEPTNLERAIRDLRIAGITSESLGIASFLFTAYGSDILIDRYKIIIEETASNYHISYLDLLSGMVTKYD